MSKAHGIGGHQKPVGRTDEWLTPPGILGALGPFDLDPCCPEKMPWQTAAIMWRSRGLEGEWRGRVWLNPPYGRDVGVWLAKLAAHRNGVALIFARTETVAFFEHVWRAASALLFLEGRLHFYNGDGVRAEHNAGAPSVLVAYDCEPARPNSQALQRSGLAGAFVYNWGVSPGDILE